MVFLPLAGCESSGSNRVASVGPAGLAGPVGPAGEDGVDGQDGEDGAPGPQGPEGPQGAEGPQGTFGLGDAGALAVGGLVGPEGIAGTGLFANTGDPEDGTPVVSSVVTESGEVVNVVAGPGLMLASTVDEAMPGATPVAGTVVGVVADTGQLLVATGDGEVYLVDGVTAVPGEFVDLFVGGVAPFGASGDASPLGVSLLSADQSTGDFLTVGLSSDGSLITLDGPEALYPITEPATDLVNFVADGSYLGDTVDVSDLTQMVVDGSGDLLTDLPSLDGAISDPTLVDDLGGLLGTLTGGDN
jgi:hypothetical protein